VPAGRGKLVHLDDIEPITWGGDEAARFLLRADDTGGLYSLYEVSVPAGEGSVVHVHECTDEAFFILEGRFEITVGDDVHPAPAGALVYGPRAVAHCFRNTWHGPSRMLCIMTPGGIETFYEELSFLVATDPPPGWDSMRQLASMHHILAIDPRRG
jgi:mannose-6-phosphate isomerase-like protein (cupin superfamily)